MSDIATLFARDPFAISDEEFKQIIAHFRESRHMFSTGMRPSTKVSKEKEEIRKLDLGVGDLDI
jgi:hypothetical protein